VRDYETATSITMIFRREIDLTVYAGGSRKLTKLITIRFINVYIDSGIEGGRIEYITLDFFQLETALRSHNRKVPQKVTSVSLAHHIPT